MSTDGTDLVVNILGLFLSLLGSCPFLANRTGTQFLRIIGQYYSCEDFRFRIFWVILLIYWATPDLHPLLGCQLSDPSSALTPQNPPQTRQVTTFICKLLNGLMELWFLFCHHDRRSNDDVQFAHFTLTCATRSSKNVSFLLKNSWPWKMKLYYFSISSFLLWIPFINGTCFFDS